jgi:hypothetical protein
MEDMMGVYNRDNINYGAAISQAIRNAERSGEIRADRIRKMGDIWAGAVKNVGDTASRAFGSAAMFSGSSASQQLAAAQAERQMLIEQEAQEAWNEAKIFMESLSENEVFDANLSSEDILHRLFHGNNLTFNKQKIIVFLAVVLEKNCSKL